MYPGYQLACTRIAVRALTGCRTWDFVQIMLARAPHVAYTTFLCVFATIAWIPIAALRTKMGNLALVVNLGFAFTSERRYCQ